MNVSGGTEILHIVSQLRLQSAQLSIRYTKHLWGVRVPILGSEMLHLRNDGLVNVFVARER